MTLAAATSFGVAGLWVRYGDTVALADVSVLIARGQITAVVGGDGAGKTSLLRCLAGAQRPDAGEVSRPAPQRVGFLPASSGLYPDLTVAENLAFRATAYRMPSAAATRRTAELIERAGLTDARDRLAGQLSGGMRQKLGVIAALLHQPDLLVLDEPSTGVDPVSRSGLWSLIASAAANGAAVMLATTYIDDAQRASAVLVLDAGHELAAGRPDQIVAAMPGALVTAQERPGGAAGLRAWRRGPSWRVWCPPGTTTTGEPVQADLQDAVTVAALARELAADAQTTASGDAIQHRTSAKSGQDAAAILAESVAVTCVFGPVTAVRDVSIEVRRGEIVGLLGANGAGKTTLIRMLLGLITPTAGQILLLGQQPSREVRRRIGYVPQGLGLYDDLTVAENLQFAAAVYGGKARAGDKGAHRAYHAAAGTASQLGGPPRPVGQLPLGLQRRAAFAEALAHEPELLILDEPTSGVDPLGRARLWQTISAAVQAGAGALVSTHYMEEAGECDRLIIMAEGEVVATGTAEQIIGAARSTIVDAADWPTAFGELEAAGLPVALAGRTLRVPGAGPDAVRAVLGRGAGRAGGDRIYAAQATLEERFFDLTLAASQRREPE
ncbi:MAG TPA: ATP-binding cassette domain-containing protein [Streptosporangiaceae bacterium]|nr:ATP-binding cassette domain-containing protein [Streptosporangiaceae bacterium]